MEMENTRLSLKFIIETHSCTTYLAYLFSSDYKSDDDARIKIEEAEDEVKRVASFDEDEFRLKKIPRTPHT
ncbi:CLUMA_CG006162, isoform A [Clunio marinus]|uniref:CLUMA_CG006162, isoform A n=1 Tax=Clunio marinus TaxID=568069 RepID=A0A1J1I2I4_9DIPT|nr:CLUMA_CG006162, isoform A [Clunio marinus]